MLDNAIVSDGEKEQDKKGSCPNCKGNLEPIDWCDDDKYECSEYCPSFRPKLNCIILVKKLICDSCGLLQDPR